MLKTGCIILTIWSLLNLVPSSVILVETLLGLGHTPAIYSLLTEDEVNELSPNTLATLDSIAVYANGLNIAFCLLSTVVVWGGLYRRRLWCFWGLVSGYSAALAAGVGGDFIVGTLFPQITAISGGILAVGLGLSAGALMRRRTIHEEAN